MKIECARGDLLQGIQMVARGISTRSTLPILSGILCHAEKDRLSLRTTDLEVAIQSSFNVKVERPGSTVVPARILGDVVRSLEESAVSLESEGGQATLRAQKSVFEIRTLPPEDFPKFPEVDAARQVKLPVELTKELVRQVGKAVSTDETRPVLTGILVTVEQGKMRMVATDSYRLAIREVDVEDHEGEAVNVLVPARTLEELAKIIPDTEEQVTLGLRENQAVFSTGETTFVSRLIEGQFPNYQQLLPANYETRIVAQKEELMAAAKRVALFAQHSAPVRLLFEDGTARLTAASQELGGASEEIEVEQEGATIEIALNAQFLIDGLATMSGETVAIELTTPLKPGLIRSVEQEHLYLIMPVRIS
jgi:DNA polymerase-3 subunit beta